MNPSLSITLKEAVTKTRLEYEYDPGRKQTRLDFRFEGREAPAFRERISRFIRLIEPYLPWLPNTSMKIDSENTFPHSSGIASSASAMGALALCLIQAEADIAGPVEKTGNIPGAESLQKASFIARLGSGSASRSIHPGLALWGKSGHWPGSSDEFSIPVTGFHASFRDMRDAILIVESGQKKVSSSAGHGLMEHNPFAKTRFRQARENLQLLKEILAEGNWHGFIAILEEEALSLHAMMMTGRPGYLLMQPQTVSILHRVREFRNDTECKIGFTLDAGANVHLIYADEDSHQAEGFIRAELVPFCEDEKVIYDRMGWGPRQF
jgi:diphosphomevalonate decarboxylase